MTLIDFKGKKLNETEIGAVLLCIQPLMSGSVDMAKVTFRIDEIANPLFEFFRARKTAVAFALPYGFPVDGDLEKAACRRNKADFPYIESKSLQDFLRHPACAQKPVALCAIADFDVGFGVSHGQVSGDFQVTIMLTIEVRILSQHACSCGSGQGRAGCLSGQPVAGARTRSNFQLQIFIRPTRINPSLTL